MGGSSATPGDLSRKHDKKTRLEREAERFSRLALIRNEIAVCRNCIDFWQVRPDFNRLRLDQAVRAISRAIAKEEEPLVQMQLDTLIGEPMIWLALTTRAYGKAPQTMRAYRQAHRGWRLAYGAERTRRLLP